MVVGVREKLPLIRTKVVRVRDKLPLIRTMVVQVRKKSPLIHGWARKKESAFYSHNGEGFFSFFLFFFFKFVI